MPLPPATSSTSQTSTTLYVDGACRGNPGKGGWGVYVEYANGTTAEFCGGEPHTTNNRMELMAAIEGLARTDASIAATVWTDSNYVQKGISEWIHGWKKKNWKKSDGGAVINADLWKQLDALNQNRKVDWRWIKGHAGHAGNEKADQLANLGLETQGASSASSKQTLAANIENSADKALVIKAKSMTPTALMDLLLPPEQELEEPDWFVEEESALQASEGDLRFEVEEAENDQIETPATPVAQPTAAEPTAKAEGIKRTHNTEHVNAFTQSGIRQLILDTETTGFDPKTGDRIVEIGVVELINRKLTGNSLHVYLNPQRLVGSSEEIHGLSDAFLSDKPLFADIVDELETFLDGAEVIAHNASFDMRFLEAEMEMAGRRPLIEKITVTDTLALAKRKHPGQKNSLDALAKRYEVKERDRTFHGALLDAEILADVYLLLTGGQVTLDMDARYDSAHANQARRQIKRKLPVIAAHPAELDLHQAWLAEMDGGKQGAISIWHKLDQANQ